jgi:hypothetical protein
MHYWSTHIIWTTFLCLADKGLYFFEHQETWIESNKIPMSTYKFEIPATSHKRYCSGTIFSNNLKSSHFVVTSVTLLMTSSMSTNPTTNPTSTPPHHYCPGYKYEAWALENPSILWVVSHLSPHLSRGKCFLRCCHSQWDVTSGVNKLMVQHDFISTATWGHVVWRLKPSEKAGNSGWLIRLIIDSTNMYLSCSLQNEY